MCNYVLGGLVKVDHKLGGCLDFQNVKKLSASCHYQSHYRPLIASFRRQLCPLDDRSQIVNLLINKSKMDSKPEHIC